MGIGAYSYRNVHFKDFLQRFRSREKGIGTLFIQTPGIDLDHRSGSGNKIKSFIKQLNVPGIGFRKIPSTVIHFHFVKMAYYIGIMLRDHLLHLAVISCYSLAAISPENTLYAIIINGNVRAIDKPKPVPVSVADQVNRTDGIIEMIFPAQLCKGNGQPRNKINFNPQQYFYGFLCG